MAWKEFDGKKVYVSLNGDRKYSGLVQEVVYMGRDVDNVEVYLFILKDKYGKLVSFSNKEIELIQEEG